MLRAAVLVAGLALLVRGPALAQETGAPQEPPPASAVDSLAGVADSSEADSAGDAAAPEPLPPTQEQLDEALRSELQAIYDRIPSMDGIEVAVSAGVVTLTGNVADRETIEEAAELAETRDGIVYVDTDLLSALNTEARLEDVGGQLRDQARSFVQMLPLLGVALLIVAGAGFLAWLVGRPKKLPFFRNVNPFLAGMLQRFLQFLIVLIGLIIALELLDATALVGAVIGTAGVGALAFGFAFKDIAENYLAGVLLSLRQPFEKNDLIAVSGREGKVVRLTGRETILMTGDGNHVQIPNAAVFREPMVNYTRNPRRRFSVVADVAAETDLARALDVGLDVLDQMRGVVDDPAPSGLVTGSGQGTMALQFFGWVDQREAEFGRVKSEAIRLIKEGLEGAGIELPSPEYRVAMGPAGALAGTDAAERKSTPTREKPVDRPTDVASAQRDVSVDTTLDDQIEEDRQAGDGENLLER